jgi:O-6-methylguanine DNA methyltransferase
MIQIYAQTVNGVWLAIACNGQIVASSFADTEQKALSNLLGNLPFNVPFQILSSSDVYANSVFTLMANILEGKEVTCVFTFDMDKLPKYTAMVLRAVMQIPLGYVSTYGAVAKAVGGGSRAVGNIMAGNIFVPFVPCHRVVKSDFSLGGYGGGLRTKYHLLMKEKRGYLESEDLMLRPDGGVLQIYPVEVTLAIASKIFSHL